VIREKGEYNTKADVYSFACTYFEMLVLKRPLEKIPTCESLNAFAAQGRRPDLSEAEYDHLTSAIKNLLQRTWAQSIAERFTMEQTYDALEQILHDLTEEIARLPPKEEPSENAQTMLRDKQLMEQQQMMKEQPKNSKRISFFKKRDSTRKSDASNATTATEKSSAFFTSLMSSTQPEDDGCSVISKESK
jgi:hypothetical protein